VLGGAVTLPLVSYFPPVIRYHSHHHIPTQLHLCYWNCDIFAKPCRYPKRVCLLAPSLKGPGLQTRDEEAVWPPGGGSRFRAQSHTGVPQDGIKQVFRHHAQRALPNVFAVTLGKVGFVSNSCLFHLIYGIAAPRKRLEQSRFSDCNRYAGIVS